MSSANLGPWHTSFTEKALAGGKEITLRFQSREALSQASVGLSLNIHPWSVSHDFCMPGSVYGGNRFRVHAMPYSPRFTPEEERVDLETTISDVQRLEKGPGPSLIDVKSGECAFPAFAIRSPEGQALILITEQGSPWGDHGLQAEESPGRDRLTLRLNAPGVRAFRARHMDSHYPSEDRGADVAEGDVVTLRFFLWTGICPDVHGLFDRLLQFRNILGLKSGTNAEIPMSHAAKLVREHYERDSWREDPGFYATDCNPDSKFAWQTGWCGGLIHTRALVHAPEKQVISRALRNIQLLLGPGQAPCGLLWGKHMADFGFTADFTHDTARPHTHRWTLTRRQGDALYYLLRSVAALEAMDPSWKAPPAWLAAIRRFAEALVGTWERFGQFGHFLDQRTGDLCVGGSTSGAIIPGALMLAHARFADARMKAVAEAAARQYAGHLDRGVTTGGPGDALQCPDSESVAGLVESYAVLHALTGEKSWLKLLSNAAAQLATWVMPYNFAFPKESEFGKLGISSTGTVLANAQNKHSAPGLCTHSGLGLLSLHRATGDARPLTLLSEIARSLPPLVSRADRPIHAKDGRPLPSGWMNERVNVNDWDDNIGGVFYGSTWCEVSLLLTWAELPGVYVRRDEGRVTCLDHVEASWQDGTLSLMNPTPFPARVSYLVEDRAGAEIPFGPAGCGVLPAVDLAPGEKKTLRL